MNYFEKYNSSQRLHAQSIFSIDIEGHKKRLFLLQTTEAKSIDQFSEI